MNAERTLLLDVSQAYLRARERFETALSVERRDEALSELQTIERCISVKEHNTEWRKPTRRRG